MKDELEEIADVLARAHRIGGAVDRPEGTRFISLSDTLARELEARLRALAERSA
jgi:hypothetical protein